LTRPRRPDIKTSLLVGATVDGFMVSKTVAAGPIFVFSSALTVLI
jgi:hypothetical protein